MTVHDFHADLAKSHEDSKADHWERVYRRHFPTFDHMIDTQHLAKYQKLGVDRLVVLADGRRVKIEEKLVKTPFDTVLLERWSDRQRRTKGWMQKNLRCDYLAYARLEHQKTFLIPWLTLKAVWETYGNQWERDYKPVIAKNVGYETECTPVPTAVLIAALGSCMEVPW